MTNYFNWNASSATTSLGAYNTEQGTVVGNIDQYHSAPGSMRILCVPGSPEPGQCGIETGNQTIGTWCDGKWLYFKWWMKFHSSFTWGNGNRKMKANRTKRTGAVNPIYTTYMLADHFEIGEANETPNPNEPAGGAIYYDFEPTTNAAVKNWQEYIIGIKHQTAVGHDDCEWKLWVNG